jgi:replicative DNA helicase
MADILRFPRDRHAALRIDLCDPGPDAPSTGKPPPHNLDAEGAVLAAIFGLLDAQSMLARYADKPDMHAAIVADIARRERALEMLRPEHFYSLPNARIFQAMQHIAKRQTPIDAQTVAAWIADHGWTEKIGGMAYIETIAMRTAVTGHADVHAALVIECWERRQMIATAQRVAAEVREDCGEWSAYKAATRVEWGRLTAPSAVLAGRPVGAVIEDARAQVREAAKGAVMGVRYPWPAVEQLVGLLARGQQTILAGLSEHGKTAAMMAIVCSVASTSIDALGFGEAVYVLTGEMPGPALMLRTACSFARVDASRVFAGYANADELAAVGRELDAIEGLPIIIDDKPAPAVEVAQRVKAHRAAFGSGRARREPKPGQTAGDLHPPCRLQLVVGDHVQDLAAKEEGRDEKDRIGNCAAGWVEHIAKGCDVATLLLSQLRAPEQKGPRPKFPPWPQVEHLFGSPNKIKATADTVIAVQRPELLMAGSVPAKWLGVVGVCRLTGRFGGAGRRVLLGFDRGAITDDLPVAARGEAYYEDEES